MKRTILGVTGGPGSGKSISSEILKADGFNVHEGSDLIREVAKRRNLACTTRKDYEHAFRLEQLDQGKDWIARNVLGDAANKLAHVGMRSRFELETIKSSGGLIVAVMCEPEVVLARSPENDAKKPHTISEYMRHHKLENSSTDFGPHLDYVVDRADHVIDNNGSIDDFELEWADLFARLNTE